MKTPAISILERGLTPDPLVFGFWKVPKDVCADVCYQSIKAGYRRLDCACDYGNEEQVGQGISRAIQDGLCKREDLFVTSKLWNTYHKPEHVKMAFQRTLQDLQLSYLDEYLIHFPISMEFVPFESKYPPEWTNLEGKVRHFFDAFSTVSKHSITIIICSTDTFCFYLPFRWF